MPAQMELKTEIYLLGSHKNFEVVSLIGMLIIPSISNTILETFKRF